MYMPNVRTSGLQDLERIKLTYTTLTNLHATAQNAMGLPGDIISKVFHDKWDVEKNEDLIVDA